MPPVIFLMGPTAAGKTDLAIHLIKHFPIEIISVDSAQVYRGMDIGTAKPSAAILAQAPHRLINIREPYEHYSAADFRADALVAMEQIVNTGNIPLLVGGTGLYFRALLYGLSELPAANETIRTHLEQEAKKRGWQALHSDLARIDPVAATRIHPNDPQRIERALEVWHLTGHPLSVLQQCSNKPILPYQTLLLACAPKNREILRNRIAIRFKMMLDQGFEQEVRNLLVNVGRDAPALRCVGYRQMVQYLLGFIDESTMVQHGIIATQRLAKRQLTWFRAESKLHWLYDEDGDLYELAYLQVRDWLAQFSKADN
ncbi:hypothetical protein TI05_09515 [Achromatium sp. WMS3]|nr:hypothetical protein TI05_09515 [Achromatium sp. WMS3]